MSAVAPETLNGDKQLTWRAKLSYLAACVRRNIARGGGQRPAVVRFLKPAEPWTADVASPGRALTEAFVARELVRLRPPGEVSVLEIGCGSGRLMALLTKAGYRGAYQGIDVTDRFAPPQSAFVASFALADVHDYVPRQPADLVMSVSVLEHVPNDVAATARFDGFVAPGGLQVHIVPSAWGMFAYLWHGWRQYSLDSVGRRFPAERTMVYSMGGFASFLLHVIGITMPELIFKTSPRMRFPRAYSHLRGACARLDRLMPFCATMYAIVVSSPQGRT